MHDAWVEPVILFHFASSKQCFQLSLKRFRMPYGGGVQHKHLGHVERD